MNKNLQVLGIEALNTHFFDGKLAGIISFIQADIERARGISKVEKIRAFHVLLPLIESHENCTPNVIRCFHAIYSSYAQNSGGLDQSNPNYDSVNCLYADDLLYLIYEKASEQNNSEYTNLLVANLEEMATGLCPQGRTIRLLQILIMLRNDLTPTSDVCKDVESIQ